MNDNEWLTEAAGKQEHLLECRIGAFLLQPTATSSIAKYKATLPMQNCLRIQW